MMNPELQKAIADVLAVVKDGAQFAAATAKAELPLLVQEYLRWGLVDHAMAAVLLGVLAYASWWAGRAVFDADTDQDGWGWIGLLCGIPGLIFAWESAYAINRMIQILIAPRVYLLETLSRLVQ